MTSFLTNHGVLVALVCGGAALVYGVVTARSLLALSPGNETMRSISAAVQEGASAYLNRQYMLIGVVGVVLFIALIPIQNIRVAIGFAIGAVLSAAAGYIGMNVSVRANARVAESDSCGTASQGRFLCAATVKEQQSKVSTVDTNRIAAPQRKMKPHRITEARVIDCGILIDSMQS